MTKDNWIKAFDEICFYKDKSDVWGDDEIVNHLNAEHLGDVQGKLIPEIKKFIQSLVSQVEKDAIEKTNKRWGDKDTIPTQYDFAINYDKSLYGKYGRLQSASMIRVERDKWAIVCAGERLTRTGKWIYQPMPSSRTDSFKKRTQFTYEEAKQRMKKILSDLLEDKK